MRLTATIHFQQFQLQLKNHECGTLLNIKKNIINQLLNLNFQRLPTVEKIKNKKPNKTNKNTNGDHYE